MVVTFDDITLAFIGAVIGLVVTLPVTYLVVDRIVERNAKKELEPVGRVARDRLATKLGVGFLTTFLITLVIDVTRSFDKGQPLEKELAESYVARLKSFQSDLELMLGVYNRVLSVEVEHLTGKVISELEHLQEDFQFLADRYPKPPSGTHVRHIESVALETVRLTKQLLELLGADEVQIDALEKWLVDSYRKAATKGKDVRIEVSGSHTV
ncbi:MAG: hypothetical protein KGI38_03910 [Thaumarchaeota archaeon]|nr:hypothetical protein [Nitrososphaerota archaeon]